MKRIIVNSGGVLSLQSHGRCAEYWVVMSGEAWLPLGTPPDNLVPFITQTAAGVREKLTVFGDDYVVSPHRPGDIE